MLSASIKAKIYERVSANQQLVEMYNFGMKPAEVAVQFWEVEMVTLVWDFW
jgi:hypothetical protein